MKKMLKLFFAIVLVCLLVACGSLTPASIVTETVAPTPQLSTSLTTSTPILTATSSPTISFTATPDFCNSAQWQGEIIVLSNDLLTALEPGGPTLFDRILVEQNPVWADFRQYDHDELRSAGVIFHETAFGPEWGTGINPAIILVTYGVERNWELPTNGDLVSEVEEIRAVLFQYRSDWVHEQVDPNQYPVANGATYVLYRYFDGDFSMLHDWCSTYVQVYGESPLK